MKSIRITLVALVATAALFIGVGSQAGAEQQSTPCYEQVPYEEYKYSKQVEVPQSHQETKYKKSVPDFKTKYTYQKQTRERSRLYVWSDWGSWSEWTWWSPPSFKTSFSNVEVLESGDHDGNTDAWATYDRDYQYVKNGVTEQIENGSHWEYEWFATNPGAPWISTGETKIVNDPPTYTTEYFPTDGGWTREVKNSPWTQIDSRSGTENGDRIACLPKPEDGFETRSVRGICVPGATTVTVTNFRLDFTWELVDFEWVRRDGVEFIVDTIESELTEEELAGCLLPDPLPICHQNEDGSYEVIEVQEPLIEAHRQHGDIYPVPQEGCPVPNSLTTWHEVECGTATIYLRNVSPWIYPVSHTVDGGAEVYGPVVDNRTDGGLNGPQKDQTGSKTFTFDEDTGVHTIAYVVKAGSENDLYVGLPVGEWTEFTVESDCQENTTVPPTTTPETTIPVTTVPETTLPGTTVPTTPETTSPETTTPDTTVPAVVAPETTVPPTTVEPAPTTTGPLPATGGNSSGLVLAAGIILALGLGLAGFRKFVK